MRSAETRSQLSRSPVPHHPLRCGGEHSKTSGTEVPMDTRIGTNVSVLLIARRSMMCVCRARSRPKQSGPCLAMSRGRRASMPHVRCSKSRLNYAFLQASSLTSSAGSDDARLASSQNAGPSLSASILLFSRRRPRSTGGVVDCRVTHRCPLYNGFRRSTSWLNDIMGSSRRRFSRFSTSLHRTKWAKAKPTEMRSRPRGSPLQSDVWIYRAVVISLAVVATSAVVGAIVVALVTSKDTPQVLIALGSAALGALAGMLSPSPRL
jgi:hypothetical protein